MPNDVANLAEYEKESYGLQFTAYQETSDGSNGQVKIELQAHDVAFALCAMIDRYGLDQTRRAIDRIAQDDPTGRRVGLSAPAKILQGIDPRKAG